MSMRIDVKSYYSPKSIAECIDILERLKGKAMVVAGGTDLVPDLKRGRKKAEILVDVTGIRELRSISIDDDFIYVGAAVTHAEIAESLLIRERAAVLSRACGVIGSPQIRNVGTIAGNVVNAMPAADAAVALFALKAEVEIMTKGSRRWEKIDNLYAGVGRSKIDSSKELVTRIRFRPVENRGGCSYQRLSRRRALSLPIVNVAVVVEIESSLKRFRGVWVAIGPVAQMPFRATKVEEFLQTAEINRENIQRAAEIARDCVTPRSSIRGSAEYKREMVRVLVKRGLEEATEQALGTGFSSCSERQA